jgi:hypothetical protein
LDEWTMLAPRKGKNGIENICTQFVNVFDTLKK